MDDGQPDYPRPVGKWWFGCDENSSSQMKVDRPHEDDRTADLIDAGKFSLPPFLKLNKLNNPQLPVGYSTFYFIFVLSS